VKLIDTDETIVIVTGSGIAAEERDRPVAYVLKQEIDQLGQGQAYRRAVVVGDQWYLENRVFHLNPTIAIGGPGANAVSAEFAGVMPTLFQENDESFVHADIEGEVKRAVCWGMNAASTEAAVRLFVNRGVLAQMLDRTWRFRTGVYV
jgi:hypothetical protein